MMMLFFSPDFRIPENPPQQLSYSMKSVYKINSTEDIKEKVKGLKGSYNIVMFSNPKKTATLILINKNVSVFS